MGRQMDGETDRLMSRHKWRWMNGETDRNINKQTERDKQIERQRD